MTLNLKWDISPQAFEKWQPEIRAAKENDNTISIYDRIGVDPWTGEGMTAKIVSSVLRKAEGKDVTVNINSGGGDFFEGLAIYNLLSEYEGNVIVNVIGLAASAASVIAMAGREINVAQNGFIMIHNAWTMAIGNKNDMKEVASVLSKFDDSMAGLYAAKTGKDKKEIYKMMDAETWILGDEAVEMGFATALLGEDAIKTEELSGTNAALRKLDTALAKAGIPRSERRAMIKDLTATPCAGSDTTPCAGDSQLVDALSQLLAKFKPN